MELIINESNLEKYGLSLNDFLYLLLKDSNYTLEEINLLEKNKFIKNNHTTDLSKEIISEILNKSREEPASDTRIEKLTKTLMNIFPQGKKEGTPYYWKCNPKEVSNKLKRFFVYFGETYSDSQIISATKRYVQSFNGDYRYMRLLKYFIWKNDKVKTDSGVSIEQVSDLASYIENEGQEDERTFDIGVELV